MDLLGWMEAMNHLDYALYIWDERRWLESAKIRLANLNRRDDLVTPDQLTTRIKCKIWDALRFRDIWGDPFFWNCVTYAYFHSWIDLTSFKWDFAKWEESLSLAYLLEDFSPVKLDESQPGDIVLYYHYCWNKWNNWYYQHIAINEGKWIARWQWSCAEDAWVYRHRITEAWEYWEIVTFMRKN